MTSTIFDVPQRSVEPPAEAECLTCGRLLKNPESVRRRRGPKCRANTAGLIPAACYEYDPAAPQLPLDA